MGTPYYARVRFIVERVGGASEMSRKVNALYPKGPKISQQLIEYLASGRPGKKGKPAQGSRNTAKLAAAGGVYADWLESETGPRDLPNRKLALAVPPQTPKGDPLTLARIVAVKIKETGKVQKVELTTEALKLAKLFMKLDDEDRLAVAQKATALRLAATAHKAPAKGLADHDLDHLAAPGTPAAKRAMARKRGKVDPSKARSGKDKTSN